MPAPGVQDASVTEERAAKGEATGDILIVRCRQRQTIGDKDVGRGIRIVEAGAGIARRGVNPPCDGQPAGLKHVESLSRDEGFGAGGAGAVETAV